MLLLAVAVALEALSNTFFVALQVQGRQDLQGKVKALAAALGFGYGLLALVFGAPPLAVAAFKLIETLVNLAGGLLAGPVPAAIPPAMALPCGACGAPCAWGRSLPSSK